jgi:YhcH/YjgK/YiaL family protein
MLATRMITDTIGNAPSYLSLSPGIAIALRFLMEPDRAAVPLGRHELGSDRVFALVQEYATKPPSECFWEAHRKYIDVQFVASGVEAIGWAPLAGMKVGQDYDEERDLLVLEGSGQIIRLEANSFAIFMPHDAHMPCVAAAQPLLVRKIVVKVAV